MVTVESDNKPCSLPIPVDRDWIAKLLKKHHNPTSRIADKALIVAPMVDQSELPYRLLCRKYGANVCFTPMINAKLLCHSEAYRSRFLGTWPAQDRPLIAQFAGSDVDMVLQAAKYVEPYVDGIDINCGCPQNIAKRGHYGAFLLEQEEVLLKLVKHLSKHLSVPLSVKVRLLPPPEQSAKDLEWDVPQRSLDLYEKLIDAGAHMLTIHGRTRHQKTFLTGGADWDTIRRAVELYGHRVPIIANGSMATFEDIEECLAITQSDGFMSSEAVLEYPPIFYNIPQTPQRTVGRLQVAQEYLDFARQYPPNKGGQGSGMKCARTHIHRFLHEDLQADHEWRSRVVNIDDLDGLQECVDHFRAKHARTNHKIAEEELTWYMRHRGDPKIESERVPRNYLASNHEMDAYTAGCMTSMFDGPLNECGRADEAGDY